MTPIHTKQTLKITLVRAKTGRYRAYVAMFAASGCVMGSDMLHGKGLSDAFASWQRLLYNSAETLKWWNFSPVLRPDLDQHTDETAKEWRARLLATQDAAAVPLKDHAGREVPAATDVDRDQAAVAEGSEGDSHTRAQN